MQIEPQSADADTENTEWIDLNEDNDPCLGVLPPIQWGGFGDDPTTPPLHHQPSLEPFDPDMMLKEIGDLQAARI
ncbi:hypothetical protein FRC01_010302, partial [Tulasnella sp. 417]